MTVQRMDGAICAAWTFVNDIGQADWMVVLREPTGVWMQLDDGGVTYRQTPAELRQFIADWQADDALEGGPGPNADTIEVWLEAADFIEQADA